MNIKFSDLFYEKVVPSQLYHVTDLHKFFKIVKQGKIKLNFSNVDKEASWEANLNMGKYFFFSMSHQKFGRYAHGSGGEKLDSSKNAHFNVNLVMDSDALRSEGKLIETDYWEHSSYANDEKEIRFISDKQVLSPLEKYIMEVHIYYNPKISNHDYPKQINVVKKLLKLKDMIDVPLYFYDDSSAYRLQLKAKAKLIEDIIPRDMKIDREKNRYRSRVDEGVYQDVQDIIDLLKGNYDEGNKRHRRILEYIRSYPRDFDTHIGSNLHNARSRHPDNLQELVDILKRYKLSDMKKIRDFLALKYRIK
jgi:hypothetical protein